MRIPTHVPIPVSIPDDKLPVVLSRKKKDFGITAAVVTALAISTAAATAAVVSLAATRPTAEAVNTLAEGMAAALQTQTQINAHLQAGILIVNQRVDLVQEQVDILGALLGLGCIAPFLAICVTPIAYTNMTTRTKNSTSKS
uniref:Retroviral envelope protein GP41-like domain-containing protein n=1 Tax=Neovison vison TaxID=452646 RepID=A0A8C7ERV4_NEOVI